MMDLRADHRTGGRLVSPEVTGTCARRPVSGVSRDDRQLQLPDGVAACAGAPAWRGRLVSALASDSGRASASGLAFSVLESPAHRCRASVRLTIWSNRRDGAGRLCRCPELPQMVSGCVVLAATVIHRSGDGWLPLVP